MKTLKKRRNPLGGGEDRSWRRKRGKEAKEGEGDDAKHRKPLQKI